MMPGTEKGNREIFVASLAHFPGELRKWAENRKIDVVVPEGWPTGGAITLTKGMQRVEIEETSPDDGGTDTKVDQVWSLKISDTFYQSKRYLDGGRLDGGYTMLPTRTGRKLSSDLLSKRYWASCSALKVMNAGWPQARAQVLYNARNHHAAMQ